MSLKKEILIKEIGTAITCFKEKFAIPRQPGLSPNSFGHIKLHPPFNKEEALRGLESFSHIIVTFIAHKNSENNENLMVRPPRLGGNKKLGVFATRSPKRPNLICTSIVKLEKIDLEKFCIHFSNHDILDKTPVVDIKPYIPRWDIVSEANEGWLEKQQDDLKTRLKVSFCESVNIPATTKEIIIEVLSLNPKPRYQDEKIEYGFLLENYDVHFKYNKLGEDFIEIKVTKVSPR